MFTAYLLRHATPFTRSRSVNPEDAARRRAALERQGLVNPAASSVRDTLFTDNDFFDPGDIVQVRYEMLRAGRVSERSVTETAVAFGVSRATYYQQAAAFSEDGIAGLIPEKRGPHCPHKLTDEVVDFVASELVQHPGLDSQAMAAAVAAHFGVQVHPRSVERAIARRGKKTVTRRCRRDRTAAGGVQSAGRQVRRHSRRRDWAGERQPRGRTRHRSPSR